MNLFPVFKRKIHINYHEKYVPIPGKENLKEIGVYD
jgi:hypothetical protein